MPTADRVAVADLLAQARGGDRAALDRLFALCRNYLGVVARAHVEGRPRTKVDASDLVQQTLLEAYRAFGQFRGATEAEWLAWLRRILSHNAADFVRRYRDTAKRRADREAGLNLPDDSAAGGPPQPADTGESPSQQFMRKERELVIADALTRLGPDHQEVITLRNLQRLPFDEVARQMNRSRPAVQMLWMRAIQQLQEFLAAD
jgi:RNA polymerase sigma-70 factor, ECF subfamily